MKTTVRRSVASLLIVSMTALGMPTRAGTVSTEDTIAAKRDRVAAMLDRADVRAQLEAHGVSASDARARVQAMTDEEVAHVVDRIDSLPAGGNPIAAVITVAAGAMYAVLTVVAIVIAGVVTVAARHSSKNYPPQPSNDWPGDDVSPFPRG